MRDLYLKYITSFSYSSIKAVFLIFFVVVVCSFNVLLLIEPAEATFNVHESILLSSITIHDNLIDRYMTFDNNVSTAPPAFQSAIDLGKVTDNIDRKNIEGSIGEGISENRPLITAMSNNTASTKADYFLNQNKTAFSSSPLLKYKVFLKYGPYYVNDKITNTALNIHNGDLLILSAHSLSLNQDKIQKNVNVSKKVIQFSPDGNFSTTMNESVYQVANLTKDSLIAKIGPKWYQGGKSESFISKSNGTLLLDGNNNKKLSTKYNWVVEVYISFNECSKNFDKLEIIDKKIADLEDNLNNSKDKITIKKELSKTNNLKKIEQNKVLACNIDYANIYNNENITKSVPLPKISSLLINKPTDPTNTNTKPTNNNINKPTDPTNTNTKPTNNNINKPTDPTNTNTKPTNNNINKPTDPTNTNTKPTNNNINKPTDPTNTNTKPTNNNINKPTDPTNTNTKPTNNNINKPTDPTNTNTKPTNNNINKPTDPTNTNTKPTNNNINKPTDPTNTNTKPTNNNINKPTDPTNTNTKGSSLSNEDLIHWMRMPII
ncbi:hypothetical protein [Candidatus Nitrosocosmicus sp. T]